MKNNKKSTFIFFSFYCFTVMLLRPFLCRPLYKFIGFSPPRYPHYNFIGTLTSIACQLPLYFILIFDFNLNTFSFPPLLNSRNPLISKLKRSAVVNSMDYLTARSIFYLLIECLHGKRTSRLGLQKYSSFLGLIAITEVVLRNNFKNNLF